jgi:hypothetical protein
MNFSLMKLASFAILVPNFYTVRAFSLGAPLPRAFLRQAILKSPQLLRPFTQSVVF